MQYLLWGAEAVKRLYVCAAAVVALPGVVTMVQFARSDVDLVRNDIARTPRFGGHLAGKRHGSQHMVVTCPRLVGQR